MVLRPNEDHKRENYDASTARKGAATLNDRWTRHQKPTLRLQTASKGGFEASKNRGLL